MWNLNLKGKTYHLPLFNSHHMTLIAVYNSEGCQGRCDAKCYEAAHPHCDCICGGVNHGKGLASAINNTRELGEKWIEAHELEHGKMQWEIPTVQQPLF